MKFHPFNIKYVEKINNSNEIIFHDDIFYEKFKSRMNYKQNFQIEEFYDNELKNINNIYGLIHTDISCYGQSEKDFLLHGDIYFLKELNSYILFSFIKYLGSTSIKNHGFFLLKEKIVNGENHLEFKSNAFSNLDTFFKEKNEKNYTIEYIGNVFLHDVEKLLKENLSSNKVYKLPFAKEKIKRDYNNFLHHSNFYLIERTENKQSDYELFQYIPRPINSEIVGLNERNKWEIDIEKMSSVYNYNEGLKCDSSSSFISGFFYECNIPETTLNIIKYKLQNKNEYPSLDERSITNYMKFFVFYTHKGLLIQSIQGLDTVEFYFDDIPIGFDAYSSFNLQSDRMSESYKKELLKIF